MTNEKILQIALVTQSAIYVISVFICYKSGYYRGYCDGLAKKAPK